MSGASAVWSNLAVLLHRIISAGSARRAWCVLVIVNLQREGFVLLPEGAVDHLLRGSAPQISSVDAAAIQRRGVIKRFSALNLLNLFGHLKRLIVFQVTVVDTSGVMARWRLRLPRRLPVQLPEARDLLRLCIGKPLAR